AMLGATLRQLVARRLSRAAVTIGVGDAGANRHMGGLLAEAGLTASLLTVQTAAVASDRAAAPRPGPATAGSPQLKTVAFGGTLSALIAAADRGPLAPDVVILLGPTRFAELLEALLS